MNMTSNEKKHVVVVGGGMAGLYAARELLLSSTQNDDVTVAIVEASTQLGGRIRGDTAFIPNHVVDIGAEYIHGKETLLTDLVQEYEREKWKRNVTNEAFISAHGDGGPHPSSGYTEDGYYGRYYMDNEMLEGNDSKLEPLHTVLASLEDCEDESSDHYVSVGALLKERLPTNKKSLHDMAVSGYANTVGCTDLDQVSLHMIQKFEAHWQENEVEGDMHMDSRIGICGIVQALVEDLQEHDDFEARLNWQVVNIQQDRNADGTVEITSSTGKVLTADAVIVTVPPPLLTQLGLELSQKKLQALEYIGYDTAIKFILKFSKRLWPSHLQSVICAACLVPEMWFHDYSNVGQESDCCLYTATCFLMSDCARNFMKCISDDTTTPCREKAASLVMDQLSEMLNVPKAEFQDVYLDSLLFDWSTDPYIKGGYMYPKVGMTQDHLYDLAEREGSVFFAGEATNTNACCTIQAAMETGVRAAKEVRKHFSYLKIEDTVHHR